MNALRSVAFAIALVVLTPLYAILILLSAWLPRVTRYRVISGWAHIVIRLACAICGIRYRVEGLEHLPRRPSVILAKHQSAWERELLWIPFFGWGLALMSPIAIHRGKGHAALREIARKGKERLEQGFWVVVFPEGTRVAPGERRKYQLGGAWLAAASAAPVVPVAHNAGLCWPRNAFVKRSGTITVRIGPAIESAGLDPQQINARAEQWIEKQQLELCPGS